MENEISQDKKSAYSNRPVWQWVLIYLVIAIVVYGAIYFLFLHKNNSYGNIPSTNTAKTVKQQVVPNNIVYKMMAKDKLGTVMTDSKGMTLYTYAKDTSGVSNCSGKCLSAWPAFVAPSQSGNLPADISVVSRSDGTLQYAWKGMPLYYYVKDGDAGDAYGNGVGGVWSVVK